MNKEEIKHFKAMLRQGSLRHMNILLDDKFQKELLNIIKDYEKLQQENKELKENFLKQTAETYLRQIRIDKAIEYIEENKMKGKYSHSGGEYDNFILLEECEINDLLEILKDSDVDE